MADAKRVYDRVTALREEHTASSASRTRVRAIMNGGAAAITALLGSHVQEDDLPWPNVMLSGLTRMAQKIGHRPDVRVDPPDDKDSESGRKRAERRQRIVESYDEADRLELQLPQVGRWLPGYGFAVWTIQTRLSPEGFPYPRAELRDPYDCYPSAWGVDQQPEELAVWRRISIPEAKRLYPEIAPKLDRRDSGSRGTYDGVGLGGEGRWSNPSSKGLSIVEFWDRDGTWTLLPDLGELVDFVPNPLGSGPAFVVAKRFAFDQLTGQYDHAVGLMAAMAKINIMSIIAMEDATFTETNIFGEGPLGGKQYEKGRFKVNKFPPGTRVEKPQSNLPYQLFETINRIERQYRMVAGYPVTDDAQSPMSFVTGAGLDELNTSPANEIREYQQVIKWALQDLDSKRLEWDEKVSPDKLKPMVGVRDGVPFTENYRPRTHIKGDYRTRRIFGMMSGWDDTTKIVGGLQLLSAGVIDRMTLRENIDGLHNLSKIDERVNDDSARSALMEGLVAASQQGDLKAVMALIEMLPASHLKTALQKYYTPEEPQMSPEEEAMLGQGQADPMAELMSGGAPPDVATVLSRLTNAGPQGGVQTVARL